MKRIDADLPKLLRLSLARVFGVVAARVAGGSSQCPSPRRAPSFSLLDALLLDGFEHRHDARSVEQVCAEADAREVAELLGGDELAY